MKIRNVVLPCMGLLAITCMSLSDMINPESPARPNVILILTDDQGYRDVGVYGAPDIETPNLDQMANEGVRLSSFYAAQAVCSASRAAILTGCYPNRIGIHNAFMPDSPVGLNPSETTLAEMLKHSGYTTALYGKWHLGDQPQFMPLEQGFDEYFGIPYSNDMWPLHPLQGTVFHFGPLPLYEQEQIIDTLTDQASLTTRITEHAVDFISRNKDRPFFLYVPHPQPHVPLFVSDKFKGKSKAGLYGDVIMEIDWSVGEILKAVKENGIDRSTIVIFTSDNGPWLAYGNHAGNAFPFREGKHTTWEGGHREPCIVRYPGILKGGRVLEEPVMAIDLLPTIAELVGCPLPEKPVDGKSAWQLLLGEKDESPQEAYYFYSKVNELQGVRYGKWKLYFPHSYGSMQGQEAGKDGLPGEYANVELTEIALFDVVRDPGETSNLAKQFPGVVQEIELLANQMRSRLGDALTGMEGSENREPGRLELQPDREQ